MVFWSVVLGFYVMVGCCFAALRAHHIRAALVSGITMMLCYGGMMTSRPLTMGTGMIAFMGLDLAVLLIGIKSALMLLEAFDTPLPDDDDEHGGGAFPRPDPDPDTGLAIEWSEFDGHRLQWERPTAVRELTRV